MTREERSMEVGRLEGISKQLMADKKVLQSIAILENGIPSLRVLTLQGDWKVIDELTSREL